MKKLVNILLVLVMLFSIAVPAAAVNEDFVPSITEKDAPELVEQGTDENGQPIYGEVVDADGNVVFSVGDGVIRITPLSKLEELRKIDVPAADMLEFVYEFLQKNSYYFGRETVVRDLFDVTVVSRELEEALAPKGQTITLRFNLNVAADTELEVRTYKNDEWVDVVDVVNNGDGTVSVTFEDFCPVAFIVGHVQMAGEKDSTCWIWWVVIIVALLLIALLIFLLWRNKKNKKA